MTLNLNENATKRVYLTIHSCRVVVVHAFKPSTWEAEAGGAL